MQRTNRRRFLAGIATTGAVLAAGCSSGASSGDGGNGSNGGNGTASGGEATDGAGGGDATSESGGSTGGGNTTAGGNGTSGGSASGGETTTVAAGPDGRLVFEPEAVELSVGDTVSWEFESAGHNVGAVPKDSEEVSLPDGAKPFASYDGDPYAVVEEGQTYEHTFETAGEYTYVCIPHVSSGMVGTVTVSE